MESRARSGAAYTIFPWIFSLSLHLAKANHSMLLANHSAHICLCVTPPVGVVSAVFKDKINHV